MQTTLSVCIYAYAQHKTPVAFYYCTVLGRWRLHQYEIYANSGNIKDFRIHCNDFMLMLQYC